LLPALIICQNYPTCHENAEPLRVLQGWFEKINGAREQWFLRSSKLG
jgi:hypothetical protein